MKPDHLVWWTSVHQGSCPFPLPTNFIKVSWFKFEFCGGFINTWSQYGHRFHVWPYFFLCLQITVADIRPQGKVCRHGECRWPLKSSSGVCVGVYGLTYSLYQPRPVKTAGAPYSMGTFSVQMVRGRFYCTLCNREGLTWKNTHIRNGHVCGVKSILLLFSILSWCK